MNDAQDAPNGAQHSANEIFALAVKDKEERAKVVARTSDTDRHPYRIRFTLGTRATTAKKTCNGLAAGQAAVTFFVGADLLQAKNGMVSRYFGINQDGIVYQSKKRVAPFYIGNPKAPAVPIQ